MTFEELLLGRIFGVFPDDGVEDVTYEDLSDPTPETPPIIEDFTGENP